MSRISCVRFEAKASVEPSLLGTIAMSEVMAPSSAFNVGNSGLLPHGASFRPAWKGEARGVPLCLSDSQFCA